jgi:hypothetical protein
MIEKEDVYKLSVSGENVTINDIAISKEMALKIVSLIMGGAGNQVHSGLETNVHSSGAGDANISPKVFMAQKKPLSEIERILCLAYYLTYHRDTSSFKTRDLSKLNTEAAQPGFSNATSFARNADAAGYLAKAGAGSKQITALGEAIVNALPDRAKVKIAIEENAAGRKRRQKKGSKKKEK